MPTPDRTFTGSIAEVYDQLLVPVLFAPYATVLGELVADLTPARVLEVAAGSGALTGELVARLPGAAITATDLSPAMLARAADRIGRDRVRWQEADARDLPVPDGSQDVWACQFGLMFVPDRRRALREAHRVLVDGGHLVASTWTGLAGNGFADVLDRTLRAVFPDDPPSFVRDVPHGYADPEQVRADLLATGFGAVDVQEVVRESRAPSARDVATAFLAGTPAGNPARAGGAEVFARTVDEVTAALVARWGGGPVAAPMAALVVTAVQR